MGHWHGHERRRTDRDVVSWPVIVEAGARRLTAETVDVSPRGAKIRLGEPLEPGTPVRLRLSPGDQRPLDVEALVWRSGPEGLAFLFLSVCRSPLETRTNEALKAR